MLELQHFVECVFENKTPSVSARDGLKALRLVEVIRQNILGQLVDVRANQKPAQLNVFESALTTAAY